MEMDTYRWLNQGGLGGKTFKLYDTHTLQNKMILSKKSYI